MAELLNTIPTKGKRRPISADVDSDGVEVCAANDSRLVAVLYNVGPDTAWASDALDTANPDDGFPVPMGSGIVDDDSADPWFFGTASGETADIRGWEVSQP